MGKINWARVLLGGLIAGVVLNVFQFAVWVPLVGRSLSAALQTLGHPMQETLATTVLMVVLMFVGGILAIWLYAAIRPRYGAGAGTAALAGVAAGVFMGVLPDIGWGLTLRLIPAMVWVGDAVTGLVAIVIATVLGAWLYKEETP
jgi:preprotein translocase subunit SecY